MLRLPASVRIFLCLVAVDMRRSFDGLAAAAEEYLRNARKVSARRYEAARALGAQVRRQPGERVMPGPRPTTKKKRI